ncbi:MAG: hypothetical protein HY841_08215 [Bacteroidetes bacterium]|nr:hypothetical protein [Bacteroidota bacterium]
MRNVKLLRQIKMLILLFIILLVLSGITAFPIKWQLDLVRDYIFSFAEENSIRQWFMKIYDGITNTYEKYPFIAYGTDWLAFAHIVIAIAFIGPYRDPVKNIWVIQFGMIASVMVFPLAFIAGNIRSIPFFWQLIDCSFGVFGFLLLYIIYRKIKKLEE